MPKRADSRLIQCKKCQCTYSNQRQDSQSWWLKIKHFAPLNFCCRSPRPPGANVQVFSHGFFFKYMLESGYFSAISVHSLRKVIRVFLLSAKPLQNVVLLNCPAEGRVRLLNPLIRPHLPPPPLPFCSHPSYDKL